MNLRGVVQPLQEEHHLNGKTRPRGGLLSPTHSKNANLKALYKSPPDAPTQTTAPSNMEFANGIKDKIEALVWTSRQGLSKKDFNKEVEKIIEGSDTSAYSHKGPTVPAHKHKSVPTKGVSKLLAAYNQLGKVEPQKEAVKQINATRPTNNLLKELAIDNAVQVEKSLEFKRKPTEEILSGNNQVKYSPRIQRPSSTKEKVADFKDLLGNFGKKKSGPKKPDPEKAANLDINGNKLQVEIIQPDNKVVYLPLVRLSQKDRARIIYAQKQELLREKMKSKLSLSKEGGGFVKNSLKYMPLVQSERNKDQYVEGPLGPRLSRKADHDNSRIQESPKPHMRKKSANTLGSSGLQGSPNQIGLSTSVSVENTSKLESLRVGISFSSKHRAKVGLTSTTSSHALPGLSTKGNAGLGSMFPHAQVIPPAAVKSARFFHLMHGMIYQQQHNPFVLGVQPQMLRFFVGPGNNQKLVYSTCKNRLPSLQESYPSKCQLSWTQNPPKKSSDQDEGRGVCPELPVCTLEAFKLANGGLTTKDPLNYPYLVKDVQSVGDLARMILETKLFECSDTKILKDLLKSLFAVNKQDSPSPANNGPQVVKVTGPQPTAQEQQQLSWRVSVYPSPYDTSSPASSLLWPLQNHVKGLSRTLTSKTGLFQTLSWFCYSNGLNPWTVIPKTYLIKSSTAGADMRQLIEEKSASPSGWTVPVIIKPGEDSNRGNGIGMGYDAQSARMEIERVLERQKSKKGTAIVQDYLTKTLLFKGRKFDIRCYGLVLKLGQVASYYWYNDGYARTSSYFYNPNEKDNLKVHLTNEAVQVKDSSSFGKYEPGNKVYFPELNTYFDTVAAFIFTNKNFYRDIVPIFKSHAKLAFRAASEKLIEDNQQCLSPSFELLGFDFMITESLEVFLIEVNHNPCLSTLTPEQGKLISKLVDETLKLTADPILMLARQNKEPEKPSFENVAGPDGHKDPTLLPQDVPKPQDSPPMFELLHAHLLA